MYLFMTNNVVIIFEPQQSCSFLSLFVRIRVIVNEAIQLLLLLFSFVLMMDALTPSHEIIVLKIVIEEDQRGYPSHFG